jgi:hypothetical protein
MWFYPNRFDVLVEGLAQRISARFPPVIANDPERAVPQKRIEEILRETLSATLQAERETHIGFLRRISLRGAFRRALRETGYEEKFVDFAADRFIEQLTRKGE